MKNPIQITLNTPPGDGKTTLMEFLLMKLAEIGAIDDGINPHRFMQKAETTYDRKTSEATETYTIDVDRDRVRAAINGAETAVTLNGALDASIFNQRTLEQVTNVMVGALDDEVLKNADRLTIAIDRAE